MEEKDGIICDKIKLLIFIFEKININTLTEVIKNDEMFEIITKLREVHMFENIDISKILDEYPHVIEKLIENNFLRLNDNIIELLILKNYDKECKLSIYNNILDNISARDNPDNIDNSNIKKMFCYLFIADIDTYYIKYKESAWFDFDYLIEKNKRGKNKLFTMVALKKNIDCIIKYKDNNKFRELIYDIDTNGLDLLMTMIKYNYDIKSFGNMVTLFVNINDCIINSINYAMQEAKPQYVELLVNNSNQNIDKSKIILSDNIIDNVLNDEDMFSAYFNSNIVQIEHFFGHRIIKKMLDNKYNSSIIQNILGKNWINMYIKETQCAIDIYKIGKCPDLTNICKNHINNVEYYSRELIENIKFDIKNGGCKEYAHEIMSIILNKEAIKSNICNICNICADNRAQYVIIPCGHTLCYLCSTKIKLCHICRSVFTNIIRFYL
jgi:hypothetical protein